jgi:lipid II:glycine glycyltransferase (peptidoglycan interpeptide bridge formation enzyme)
MYFDWTFRTLQQWKQLLEKAPQANWMQTWAYAQASFKKDWIPTQMAAVAADQGQLVAIFALQKVKLGPIQFIRINRGPLWIKTNVTEGDLLQFAQLLRTEFPKSWLTKIKWLPEFNLSPQGLNALEKINFKLAKKNFQTTWLDLSQPEEVLRAALKQKWRNSLNKFDKSNITIKIENTPGHFSEFLNFYELYKRQKNFTGPSREFLGIEFSEAFRQKQATLLWAMDKGLPIAGIAIHAHGNNISYRAGWNSAQGRLANAHYGLIWRAMMHFKKLGFEQFDLGGILPVEAQGLTHFKLGLGGVLSRSEILEG